MLRLLLTAVVVTSAVVLGGIVLREGGPGHDLRPAAAVAEGLGALDDAPSSSADGGPVTAGGGHPSGGGGALAGRPDPRAGAADGWSAEELRAARVVARWDRQRAAAWSRADPERLASLYVDGSAAARHDVAMLRAWTARGLRVRGMTTRLVDVEVLRVGGAARATGRPAARLRLRVVDRLVGARAVGRGVDVRLPRDRATAREITLVRERGGWLVAEVVPA
ncbi:hypothetical protein [Nocardioides sp. P86]|uniref:hypothetical protein n=1 Tax=Nocardioides sp. P86 TaxID=2939569 RepID=UPI0020415680|nr:hypothetical protein [Nocardioides sp. P86]MCM3513808.1 hypothetical protein [Nocardioides sp. P86]